MKFRDFKNEQEFMDSINEGNKMLLVDYAMDLHERFGITMDEAIAEVKRMMEAKARGEKIETNYPEEDALEYRWKKEHPLVPRERTKHPNCGKYNESEQIFLIEQELYTAIRTFHDHRDAEYREFYAKDYFEWFNEHYGIDPKLSCKHLEEMFEDRRNNSEYKYEHYKGKKLAKILGVNTDEEKIKKDEAPNFDDSDDAR